MGQFPFDGLFKFWLYFKSFMSRSPISNCVYKEHMPWEFSLIHTLYSLHFHSQTPFIHSYTPLLLLAKVRRVFSTKSLLHRLMSVDSEFHKNASKNLMQQQILRYKEYTHTIFIFSISS